MQGKGLLYNENPQKIVGEIDGRDFNVVIDGD